MDIKLFKKSLASRTNPSLLKEDLDLDRAIKQYEAATGGWTKITKEYFGDYGVTPKGASALARAKDIYVYDDEEGGMYNDPIIVAKDTFGYLVVSGNSVLKFVDALSAVKTAAESVGLQRI